MQNTQTKKNSDTALETYYDQQAGRMVTVQEEDEDVFHDHHEAVPWVDPVIFKRVVNTAIFANAIQLGICVQYKGTVAGCVISELCFLCIFGTEMVLKLIEQRYLYFRSNWNLLDFGLVNLSILDIIFSFPGVACPLCGEFSLLRLLRLSRTFRLFRVLRVNQNIMILTEGLLSAIKAMIWVATLLFVLVYAGGIFAFGAFGDAGEEIGWAVPYFDTLFDSMMTLFSIAIVDLWDELVRPLAKVYPGGLLFLLMYIFMSSFGILNLLIGIITESTAKAAKEFDKHHEKLAKKAKMRYICQIAEELFDDAAVVADDEISGSLSASALEKTDVQLLSQLLQEISLPPGFSIEDFHLMCSAKPTICKHEFVDAMRRVVLCNQFERDCLFQHAINDMRRRFLHVEAGLRSLHNFIERQHEATVEEGNQHIDDKIRELLNASQERDHPKESPFFHPEYVYDSEQNLTATSFPHEPGVPTLTHFREGSPVEVKETHQFDTHDIASHAGAVSKGVVGTESRLEEIRTMGDSIIAHERLTETVISQIAELKAEVKTMGYRLQMDLKKCSEEARSRQTSDRDWFEAEVRKMGQDLRSQVQECLEETSTREKWELKRKSQQKEQKDTRSSGDEYPSTVEPLPEPSAAAQPNDLTSSGRNTARDVPARPDYAGAKSDIGVRPNKLFTALRNPSKQATSQMSGAPPPPDTQRPPLSRGSSRSHLPYMFHNV